jgi:thiol-disulfide isomerase/thioredoxin
MKKILLSFGLLAIFACGSQQTTTENTNNDSTSVRENIRERHRGNTSPLLAKGNIGLAEIQAMPWYESSYQSYQPNAEALQAFKKAMKKHDYNIDVYFGTWCGDSRREVPKLIKLMEMADADLSRLTFVSVNRSKQVPDVMPEVAQKLNIHHVPTIIFYENGTETERFVERSKESLEKDLVKIAMGDEYLDRYGE